MLLSSARILTSCSRSTLLSSRTFQNFNRQLQILTPLASHRHNFHQLSNANRRRYSDDETGLFQNSLNSYHLSNDLRKFIHGQSSVVYSKQKSDDDQTRNNEKAAVEVDDDNKKLGLVARFKKMAKEYWYVLIPVHCFTSCFWFGGFYYASKCGVDIVGMLEAWKFSEVIINPLRDSHLGHIAVAYLLYKIATPARYTVTLGGTTFAIRFLSQKGYIRPMPTKDKLVQMYKDKKEDIQQKVSDKKNEITDKFRKNE